MTDERATRVPKYSFALHIITGIIQEVNKCHVLIDIIRCGSALDFLGPHRQGLKKDAVVVAVNSPICQTSENLPISFSKADCRRRRQIIGHHKNSQDIESLLLLYYGQSPNR